MADRYDIEFTDDKPGVVETVITGGLAPLADHVIRGDEKGWYCTITDSITGLHCTYHGSTKASAQERAMRHLKDLIEGHEQEVAQQQRNEREQERQSHRKYEQPAQSRDNALYELLGKIIGAVLIIAAAVWLLFAVALPLFIINLAAIALVAGIMEVKWQKYLFPLSILAAAYLIADYNKGWFTLALGNNGSFLKGVIPVLFYLNIVAALVASYFLVRNYLNAKTPPAEGDGEFSKRNLTVMGCLVVLAGLIAGIQYYISPARLNNSSATVTTAASVVPPNATANINTPQITNAAFAGNWSGDVTMILKIAPSNSNYFKVQICTEDGCQDYTGELQSNGIVICTQKGGGQFYLQKKTENSITGYMNYTFYKMK